MQDFIRKLEALDTNLGLIVIDKDGTLIKCSGALLDKEPENKESLTKTVYHLVHDALTLIKKSDLEQEDSTKSFDTLTVNYGTSDLQVTLFKDNIVAVLLDKN